MDPTALPGPVERFLNDRHLATLTTIRPDGTPHVVPVGFTWEATTCTARVITSAGSVKAMNLKVHPRAVLCQVDGGRWVALEGEGRVVEDPSVVADAERRYAERYQTPRPNNQRVALVIVVGKVLGRVSS